MDEGKRRQRGRWTEATWASGQGSIGSVPYLASLKRMASMLTEMRCLRGTKRASSPLGRPRERAAKRSGCSRNS